MLLLIRSRCNRFSIFINLYIPLCFYLYGGGTGSGGRRCALHSTMLLLIQKRFPKKRSLFFLYIPLCFYLYVPTISSFAPSFLLYIPLCFYLYLSRKMWFCSLKSFTFHYASTYTTARSFLLAFLSSLHSTMLLLILMWNKYCNPCLSTLHSTMLLLIQKKPLRSYQKIYLYIPLCFYLYIWAQAQSWFTSIFTFHYASTYTRTISGAIFTILFSYKLSTPFC